jgi:hypothetical protein
MPPRSKAGDHIKVRRWLVYTHHGIYVNDARVIDFSGVHIWEKHGALVRPRPLKDFEREPGKATRVGTSPFLGGLAFWPGPDWEYSPADVERRAEALCKVAATQGAYHLGASNCEHIANWCKYGAHESQQVRLFHAGHALVSFGLLVALARVPNKWRPALTVAALASAGVTVFMQYAAWATPNRWRPIIAEAETILDEFNGETGPSGPGSTS